jgi:hypothetical protein
MEDDKTSYSMIVTPIPGAWGPSYRFPIELGKVREFARATGCTSLDHLRETQPVIPLYFLVTAAHFWGYTIEHPDDSPLADLPIDRSQLLHAEEEIQLLGSLPRAGDELLASSRLAEVTEKRSRRSGTVVFITIETMFTSSKGKPVARQLTTVAYSPNPESEAFSADPVA